MDGKDQLIDADTFRTDRTWKEYSIEEADDAAEHTGSGQDYGAFYKSVFLNHKTNFHFFINIFFVSTWQNENAVLYSK